MGRNNDSWGIEVGANAIKAVHLTSSGKGKVHLAEHVVIPFKQVLTTPDLNIDEAIQVKLDELMASHDMSKSTVTISVPGHMAFARFAKLPPVPPKEVPKVVRYEAVQQIPFPIEQVEWDYQVFQQEDSPEVEVGIFAITKEKVMNYLTNYNTVNLRVDAMTLSPLAVFNAFVYDSAEEPAGDGVIYMDIGTTSTDVIIVEDGGIWLRTLPLGGNTFTEALIKAFKLSYHKAEKLKKEAATSKYARQIFQAMRPVFADLVQELQRSLGYYQSLNRDANLSKLVCVGSTFKLPGLQKFLKQQLQMDVERPDGYERITVDDKQASDFADKAVNLATAYGLALQGLGLETVSANVMPSHVIRQRMWKAKQPWIAAAAACFVAMAGVAAGTAFKISGQLDSSVEQAAGIFRPVDSTANEFKQRFQEIDTTSDPRQRIENLRGMLDSRDFWPMLLEDISHATMALDPQGEQAEMLTNNYTKIAETDRTNRKRIYINSISSAYNPGGESAEDETDPGMMDPSMMGGYGEMGGGYGEMGGGYGGMGGGGYGEMGGGYGGMGGGYGGMGMGGPTGEVGKTYTITDFFSDTVTAPHFVVTIRGTTPNSQGSKFLEENFVGWLKQNADNKERPYKFIIDANVVSKFSKVQVAPGVGEEGPGGMGVGGGYGGAPGGYGGAAGGYGGAPGGYGEMGGMGGGMGGTYGGGMGATDLASLLPQRPLAKEDRSSDWQFEIQWKVELRDPTATAATDETDVVPDLDSETPGDEPLPETPDPGPTAVLPQNDEDERGDS